MHRYLVAMVRTNVKKTKKMSEFSLNTTLLPFITKKLSRKRNFLVE